MYYEKGTINGRTALAFWPESPANYRPKLNLEDMPDFVLQPKVRPRDGMALVADDRVDVERVHNTIIGHAPDLLRGMLEIRGIGIIDVQRMFGANSLYEKHRIDLVIDTPPQGIEHQHDGFVIRRAAIETGVNVITALDTARALITSLEDNSVENLTLVDIAKL